MEPEALQVAVLDERRPEQRSAASSLKRSIDVPGRLQHRSLIDRDERVQVVVCTRPFQQPPDVCLRGHVTAPNGMRHGREPDSCISPEVPELVRGVGISVCFHAAVSSRRSIFA
jgi:hypothetical protein